MGLVLRYLEKLKFFSVGDSIMIYIRALSLPTWILNLTNNVTQRISKWRNYWILINKNKNNKINERNVYYTETCYYILLFLSYIFWKLTYVNDTILQWCKPSKNNELLVNECQNKSYSIQYRQENSDKLFKYLYFWCVYLNCKCSKYFIYKWRPPSQSELNPYWI